MIQRIVGTIFKRCFASVKNVAKIGSTSFPTPTTLLVVGVIHGGPLQRPFFFRNQCILVEFPKQNEEHATQSAKRQVQIADNNEQ